MPIYFKYKHSSVFSRAFTLIELMVVISIATIIMTALIIQQSRWNNRLHVSTQAYDLALMIRQAQIYSLGVREDVGGSGDKFAVGYGIYMDENNPDRYIFFADRDNDGRYDESEDEEIETKIFSRGVTIEDVCGDDRCFYSGGGSLQRFVVTFLRPNTAANIKLMNWGWSPVDDPPVEITLRSPSSASIDATVRVTSSGQIAIIE